MESGKNRRHELGLLGEQLACEFLRKEGHTILERNWRSGHLEIDIISYNADGIHFVEVKTRCENIQAPPQENVRHGKQRNIVKAAQAFIRNGKGVPYGNYEYLFDVVAVTFEDGRPVVKLIPQAYIPIFV